MRFERFDISSKHWQNSFQIGSLEAFNKSSFFGYLNRKILANSSAFFTSFRSEISSINLRSFSLN